MVAWIIGTIVWILIELNFFYTDHHVHVYERPSEEKIEDGCNKVTILLSYFIIHCFVQLEYLNMILFDSVRILKNIEYFFNILLYYR